MSDDIVKRLRETGGLDASLHNKAADEIERLRNERLDHKLRQRLGTGQRRLYIVQARDYTGGTIAASRIANAASLAAMVERCIEDIEGKDAKSMRGDHARSDAWVTICACDMEVADE
jgi:hypothetical protein